MEKFVSTPLDEMLQSLREAKDLFVLRKDNASMLALIEQTKGCINIYGLEQTQQLLGILERESFMNREGTSFYAYVFQEIEKGEKEYAIS